MNRPAALNALTTDMIHRFDAQLGPSFFERELDELPRRTRDDEPGVGSGYRQSRSTARVDRRLQPLGLIPGEHHPPAHVAEMLVTSILIPPLAVYWRLRGALRYRVAFL